MNPYDAAHALAKTLRESADFKELKDARDALKADRSARDMLVDFRKEQLEMQKQQISGIEIAPEQEEKLEKLFQVINMNNTVKRFLSAEYRAAVLLQDIHKIIGEATADIADPDLMGLPEDDAADSED